MDAMIDMASMTKINAVPRVDGKVYCMGAYVLWFINVGARISESDDKIVGGRRIIVIVIFSLRDFSLTLTYVTMGLFCWETLS